jgi:hypothetical protein
MSSSEAVHEDSEISDEVGSLVKESINDSMRDLIGEDARKAALFRLEVADYEKHPKEFHVHLGVVFKQSASVIEKVIVRDVYSRLDLRFDDDGKVDYERSMKFAFEEASKKHSERGSTNGAHGKQ